MKNFPSSSQVPSTFSPLQKYRICLLTIFCLKNSKSWWNRGFRNLPFLKMNCSRVSDLVIHGLALIVIYCLSLFKFYIICYISQLNHFIRIYMDEQNLDLPLLFL